MMMIYKELKVFKQKKENICKVVSYLNNNVYNHLYTLIYILVHQNDKTLASKYTKRGCKRVLTGSLFNST